MGAGEPSDPQRGPGRAVSLGARIRVLSGFYEGLEVPVDRDWLVIGRGRGADLVLALPTISRAHAAIGWDRGGFFVEDLGSTNGTLLNGERRERSRLTDGDEIQMGKLRLSVRIPT
jgi:pSer/pThr/pTyr-binding forkhead associated (FHA) protein